MASFADDIKDGLAEVRTELGGAITYTRKGGNTIAISKAVKASPVHTTQTSQGVARRSQADDWLIAVADLVDGGSLFKPARDDTITYDDGTEINTYRVLPFEGNNRAEVFEHSDAAETQYRVHARLTKETAS